MIHFDFYPSSNADCLKGKIVTLKNFIILGLAKAKLEIFSCLWH